jgi:hypothetical protein
LIADSASFELEKLAAAGRLMPPPAQRHNMHELVARPLSANASTVHPDVGLHKNLENALKALTAGESMQPNGGHLGFLGIVDKIPKRPETCRPGSTYLQ